MACHVYFVSYQWKDPAGSGFGVAEIPYTKEITSLADILVIRDYIKSTLPNATDVNVLYYSLLRVE